MIIRRVARHFREQNWLAVILDLLVVIFGIFIGLQVSNLNNQRIANNDLKAYLQDLTTEYKNSRDIKINHIQWQSGVVDGLQLVLDTLDGYEPNEEELDHIYFALSVLDSPPPLPDKKEVLLEMQSTGAIQLLPRGELRSALMESLSQFKVGKDFFERDIATLSAPPISAPIVTWAIAQSDDHYKQGRLIIEHVDFDLAKQSSEFRLRVMQGYALYTSVRIMNWQGHQEDTLLLNMLKELGYEPKENWLKKNLDFIMAPPKNGDWKQIGQ